jgi:hypothetical protein
LIQYVKLLHGFYNALVLFLFFYQAWLGLTIRRTRRSKAPFPVASVKRHRKAGPVLAILGGLGFLVGLTLVLMDTGRILEYPLHLCVGLVIVPLLISAFIVSRKIKGPDSPFRMPHFILGMCILLLYVIQSFLGLGILF